MSATPCSADPQLFDNPLLEAHLEAVKLCRTCPVLDQCSDYLRQQKIEHPAQVGGPVGTWAGKLMDKKGQEVDLDTLKSPRNRRLMRILAEEEAYTDYQAKAAHADYVAGDQSEWARTGDRVYKRRNAAKNKAAA